MRGLNYSIALLAGEKKRTYSYPRRTYCEITTQSGVKCRLWYDKRQERGGVPENEFTKGTWSIGLSPKKRELKEDLIETIEKTPIWGVKLFNSVGYKYEAHLAKLFVGLHASKIKQDRYVVFYSEYDARKYCRVVKARITEIKDFTV